MILGTETEYTLSWEQLRSASYTENGRPDAEVDLAKVIQRLENAIGWLPCGGLFYIDMSAVPEFASPECTTIREVVKYEKVGERIVWIIVQKHLADFCVGLDILKTSGDSYNAMWTKGAHENYLIPRALFEELKNTQLIFTRWCLAFLVTRQILSGAGWLYLGGRNHPLFSISQRSHRLTSIVNPVGTTSDRPIINLKDEPMAPAGWARLHLIVGDNNRCDLSIFLKVGTTAMLLEFLADRFLEGAEKHWSEYAEPLREVDVRNPTEAVKLISRDLSTNSRRGLFIGPVDTAWAMQDLFCETLSRWYDSYRKDSRGPNKDYELVLTKWREALDALRRNPRELAGLLDWPTKLVGIEEILNEHGISLQAAENHNLPDDTKNALASFEHSYSSLNPAASIFEAGVRDGMIYRLVSDAEIERAMLNPPRRTRAFFRGHAARLCLAYLKSRRKTLPEDTIPRIYGFLGPENNVGMDWQQFWWSRPENLRFSVMMPEPWNEYSGELKRLREFIKLLPRSPLRS
jgi:hypothetical protein